MQENHEVILLTIDSLRSDYFNKNIFPECWPVFDSEFAYFANTYSNGIATPLSFPSIITGKNVEEDGTLDPSQPTIAELYNGYSWAVTNNAHLRPDRGYDRGFDSFQYNLKQNGVGPHKTTRLDQLKNRVGKIDLVSEGYYRVKKKIGDGISIEPREGLANEVVEETTDALSTSRGLFWAHFMDPHYPFQPQKILDQDIQTTYSNHNVRSMNNRFREGVATAEDLKFLRQMYKESIKFLDRKLKSLFSFLKSKGRWEESLIIVLADHGEAFGEHGMFNHQWDSDPIDCLVKVPLLVKYPNEKHVGEKYNHLVQTGDVTATVASELKWDIENEGCTKPLTDITDRVVLSKSNTAVRVTTKNGYGIQRTDGSTDLSGDLESEAKEILKSTIPPNVENMKGNVPGMGEEERRNIEKQLEYLGYK